MRFETLIPDRSDLTNGILLPPHDRVFDTEVSVRNEAAGAGVRAYLLRRLRVVIVNSSRELFVHFRSGSDGNSEVFGDMYMSGSSITICSVRKSVSKTLTSNKISST